MVSFRPHQAFSRMGWLLGLFLCVLLLLPIASNAFAAGSGFGFGPQTYQNGTLYGNGVYFAPYSFTLYEKPQRDATQIGTFRWNHNTTGNTLDVLRPNGEYVSVSANQLFLCFYPELDVAMMAATGDDETGWVEVVYDQAKHKTAWVQLKPDEQSRLASAKPQSPSGTPATEPAHFGVYQTWLEFMKLNSKASGIYWLSGVNEYNRSIRSKDEDTAKLLPVTLIRDLKVRFVRGNWLLVEVLDFERNTPIGWVRWRDDDGNLMVFPNISGKHLPIVTTAY